MIESIKQNYKECPIITTIMVSIMSMSFLTLLTTTLLFINKAVYIIPFETSEYLLKLSLFSNITMYGIFTVFTGIMATVVSWDYDYSNDKQLAN